MVAGPAVMVVMVEVVVVESARCPSLPQPYTCLPRRTRRHPERTTKTLWKVEGEAEPESYACGATTFMGPRGGLTVEAARVTSLAHHPWPIPRSGC